jgi:hypothetical protein
LRPTIYGLLPLHAYIISLVVTNDDHFQYVEGLQVENWSEPSAPSQSE